MLKRIIKGLAALIVVALVFAWILQGGPSRAWGRIKSLVSSEFSWSTGIDIFSLRLPYQPESLFPGIEIGENGETGGASSGKQDVYAEAAAIEQELEALERRAREVRELGVPSPYADSVAFVETEGVMSGSPQTEHVRIAASSRGDAVPLSGWSLQSAVSGIRAYIPPGVSPFVLGSVNAQAAITLAPGGSVVVTSGTSPLGTSFEENVCTGYLAQFQTFSPPLAEQCPSPQQELPLTADTIRRYGDACIDFVRTLPACRFFSGFLPAGASPACGAFVGEALSYNGCIARHERDADFRTGVWRVYLGSPAELWRNSHDVIRLLDAEGRTVDVLTY